MNFDLPNWLSGLDESGWIAILLLVAFVIITSITVYMIWKLMRQTRRPARGIDIENAAPTPRTTARKTAPGTPDTKVPAEDVDPVAEAEVFLTYGLYKQAIKVLEKHLVENPDDTRASEMLDRAIEQSSDQAT